MNDWQQGFLRKLEGLKKQWVGCFEEVVNNDLAPTFCSIQDFTSRNGFTVSTPQAREGVRSYKFSLTENAYALVSFRMVGIGQIESCCDAFAPGWGNLDPIKDQVDLAETDAVWFRKQFERSLDHFVSCFVEAVGHCVGREEASRELVGASA